MTPQQALEIKIMHRQTIHTGNSVNTDRGLGSVKLIAISPYWNEEIQGIRRAYVVGDGWADYYLASELELI